MGGRRGREEPEIISKDFTLEEIKRGKERLKRRIADVQALVTDHVQWNDVRVQVVESNIRDTIRDVFGSRSAEFLEHQDIEIFDPDPWSEDWQQDFRAGAPRVVTILEGLIARLKEKEMFLVEDPKSQAIKEFRGRPIHPRIADACADLFRDGHYSEAVFEATKALINFVKERSGRNDLDGAGLMRTVFSRADPILAFNKLTDQSDLDEQEGMMHLFEGAVLAIRNPRGHSFPEDPPERALEYISLLSLLANRLEETRRRKP